MNSRTIRLPNPGTAARKSSAVAVFRLSLAWLGVLVDWAEVELLLSVVEEVTVAVAVEHAANTSKHSNTSEIKVDFLFILFSNLVLILPSIGSKDEQMVEILSRNHVDYYAH